MQRNIPKHAQRTMTMKYFLFLLKLNNCVNANPLNEFFRPGGLCPAASTLDWENIFSEISVESC